MRNCAFWGGLLENSLGGGREHSQQYFNNKAEYFLKLHTDLNHQRGLGGFQGSNGGSYVSRPAIRNIVPVIQV